ncbi:hypothetical protein SDC9_159265 [bioreactor metagenome]|uniref:Uncharacterized protein n=1 Tax=bioreactor metagenome TaxID=1076179 RepID=A0A645FED4_9ZZZZ
MQLICVKGKTVCIQILPDQKAHPSDDDQGDHHQIHKGIPRVSCQRGISPESSHQIESRVAKSRHRVKHGAEQTFAQSHFGTKAQSQKHGADALADKSSDQNMAR